MKVLTGFSTTTAAVAFTVGSAIFTGGTAVAQSGGASAMPAQTATQPQANQPVGTSAAQDASPTYATGKPLEMQSKEGFWGRVNPFAHKKWVHRQIDPVADRANELDQLQAKNSNDIKDVDARATAGIGRAMNAAGTADAHAADASGRADHANATASAADAHTSSLNGTVSNLDQYSEVRGTSLLFVPGRTSLTVKQKTNLDDVAASLASQKGYVVEIQGYSRSGVATSQAMADSVVRYLVTAHQVPMYRIYRTGLGKVAAPADSADSTTASTKPLTNGVRVTVLQNSLATMASGAGASAPTATAETPLN